MFGIGVFWRNWLTPGTAAGFLLYSKVDRIGWILHLAGFIGPHAKHLLPGSYGRSCIQTLSQKLPEFCNRFYDRPDESGKIAQQEGCRPK